MRHTDEMNHISGQLISETINRQGESLFRTVAGAETLKQMAQQYKNVDASFTQGRMFEIIETTKFNSAAAQAGASLKAVMTEHLGMPHHESDIFIQNARGNILREVQAKSSKSAGNATGYIIRDKYQGMDRLINKEHVEKAEELLDQRISRKGINLKSHIDAKENLQEELSFDGVKSGGTTYQEAMNATENPQSYAKKFVQQEAVRGASEAMLSGALAGAFVGGLIEGSVGAIQGEFSGKEVAATALKGSASGAAVGGIAYGLKYTLKKNPIMSNGTVVGAIASSAVNITELTYQFIKQELTIEEYVEKLGTTAVSSFSGLVLTVAGTALLGPVGGAVAGTVMLISMKQLHQAFLAARADLALVKEERAQAEVFLEAVKEVLREETYYLEQYYTTYHKELHETHAIIQSALQDDAHTPEAIVKISQCFSIELKYNTQEEFNDFMLSNQDLIL